MKDKGEPTMEQILMHGTKVFNRGAQPTERTVGGSTRPCIVLVTLDDTGTVVHLETVDNGLEQPDYIPSEYE